MAVNNLDLDAKFWDLGPGWRFYPTQPLSLDLYRQKYAKTPVRFRFFKSYDRLNQHMYEHSRFFRLHQNRTTGADFVINTAYPLCSPASWLTSEFSNNQIGEIHDHLNK